MSLLYGEDLLSCSLPSRWSWWWRDRTWARAGRARRRGEGLLRGGGCSWGAHHVEGRQDRGEPRDGRFVRSAVRTVERKNAEIYCSTFSRDVAVLQGVASDLARRETMGSSTRPPLLLRSGWSFSQTFFFWILFGRQGLVRPPR